MIARVPIHLILVASVLIVLLPDTIRVAAIPLEWLLSGIFCLWRLWLYYHIKAPRCPAERQQAMLELVDAGLKLAQNEQQRALLLQWAQANARGTQQQAGGD